MIDKRLCNGCSACANICPTTAISMCMNNEGFLYPQIDRQKCIHCGLCDRACEIKISENNYLNPKCYAVMASDELRKESSSGGAFSVIAGYVLSKNGYICGCTYNYEDLKAKHIIVNKTDDLYKLRGSKYIQSEIGTCYKEIKRLLQDNNYVLFTGTPCQVAGLKRFLLKDYDKLITIDILCHGVPSPKVYQKYLKELCQSVNEKVLNISFRNKEYGWTPKFTTTTTTTTTTYTFPTLSDNFLKLFLKNICLRKSCTNCQYCSTKRMGDFTIGDFWRIEYFDKKLDDGNGTSIILVNNPEAEKILENIKQNFKKMQKVPIKYAIAGNKNLYTAHKSHPKRKQFFVDLDNYSIKQLTDKYIYKKYDCGIMNYWASWNYGAIMTCFALQEVLKNMGFTTQVINYRPKFWKNKRLYPQSEEQKEFVRKYFDLSSECTNKKQLEQLNDKYEIFISGSDQTWSWWYDLQYVYFFDFVKSYKKKIACAVSLVYENFRQSDAVKTTMEYYMKKFDAISVREKNAVKILKNEFNVEAINILDPVFLLPVENYERLITNSSLTDKDYIFIYMFNFNKHIALFAAKLAELYKCKIVRIERGKSIEDWLYRIKNAKFMITDSYHGACFGLIFEKQMIVIPNSRGNSRFQSLFSIFNIEQKLFMDKNNVDALLTEAQKNIDYGKIKNILDNEKEKSLVWLKNVLLNPKEKFKESIESRFLDVLIKNNNKIPKGVKNFLFKLKDKGYLTLKKLYINTKVYLFLITGCKRIL